MIALTEGILFKLKTNLGSNILGSCALVSSLVFLYCFKVIECGFVANDLLSVVKTVLRGYNRQARGGR